MKKMTAAALAATMTLSLGMAPAADAASTTVKGGGTMATCTIKLDGQAQAVTVYRNKIKNDKRFEQFTAENVATVRASSDLGEAFGSSDAESIAIANNAEAVQACIEGKDYQSQPMTDTKKAGIIIGVVIAILGAVATAAAPFLQQMMP